VLLESEKARAGIGAQVFGERVFNRYQVHIHTGINAIGSSGSTTAAATKRMRRSQATLRPARNVGRSKRSNGSFGGHAANAERHFVLSKASPALMQKFGNLLLSMAGFLINRIRFLRRLTKCEYSYMREG
jgi:hypothetical protein